PATPELISATGCQTCVSSGIANLPAALIFCIWASQSAQSLIGADGSMPAALSTARLRYMKVPKPVQGMQYIVSGFGVQVAMVSGLNWSRYAFGIAIQSA